MSILLNMDNYVNEIYSVILSLHRSRDLFKTDMDFLDKCRRELEPFVFRALENIHGPMLNDYWNSIKIPRVSDKAICIVERRCHPNLKFCLQNAAFYARDCSIYIFCSVANIDYINTICGGQFENIHVFPIFNDIGTPEQGKKEYNELLKSHKFWQTFKEDYVITIETDSYFLKPIPDSIYNFDYVASKWVDKESEPGGGGLSCRKLSVMKEILAIEGNAELNNHEMQDTFASHGIQLLNKKYPNLEESRRYFTEGQVCDFSSGVHQWWTFIHNLKEDNILYLIEVFLTLEKL